MMRRLLALVALCAVLVVVPATTAGAAVAVPQRRCKAGTFATWTVKRGQLRAVCVGAKPLAFGTNYGAGTAYAPRCPSGQTAALTNVDGTDLAAARCKR